MTKVVNFTPFANLRFSNRNAAGKEFGIFMVKTVMDIHADGECHFSSEQEPFVFTDNYHGELNVSSLRYPSDFVPHKPHSEIILDATAYAPQGEPVPEWQVCVKVRDELGDFTRHKITVTGPRQWQPIWSRELNDRETVDWRGYKNLFRGWKLSAPSPIDQLPIRYEYAFGGMVNKGVDEHGNPVLEAFEQNPIGRGLIDRESTDHTRPIDAPQLLAHNAILADPYTHQTVEGFGPIPPAWLPRRKLGGTYDEHWIEHEWPNWAKDYDYQFHNAAHPRLQGNRFLEGDVHIELHNLYRAASSFAIRLPGRQLTVVVIRSDGSEQILKLALDTVFLEIGEPYRDDPRAYCVWRTPFDLLSTEVLVLMQGEETEALVSHRLTPDEVACDPALLDPDPEEEAA
ncbi:DUF2169 domain-containing protein [Rhizobium etli]|uniref:DUF2169 domain-containing protein n=1 Tax=Rhizobium etli TaxID=29449 RepID=A0A7W6VBG1_RHIET|nr:DUF2169 domain-containing protein [Rhizobium etli]MBB4481153.1 hypothetical protein [Rhizobium etli]MBB4537232.1 hypothetical protein [Rhizobium etli]